MICPKCGFEQPDSPECMRCGVVVSRYKGPVVDAAASPPPPPAFSPAPAPFPPLSMEGAGTVYGSPPPGGGTIYGGLPPSPAVAVGPAFRGTFEIGKVLSESFSVYFSNFIPFVLLTALALSPLYLVQAYMTTAKLEPSSETAVSFLFFFVSAILCPYIATSAITFGVFQQMRGRDTSIGECLSRGLSCLLPVLGLAIVQGLGILLGYALCIIPGIIFALQWSVSVPAAVEEQPGIRGAMARSKFLTEGYRGDIFGVLFVLGILSGGAALIVNLAVSKNQALQLVLSGVSDLLFVGLSATATAVMYYRLRSIKESIDVDQISSVFA
jgi:hypothetical protein